MTSSSRWIAGSVVLVALLLCGGDSRADAVCSGWPDGTLCRPENPCLGTGVCRAGDCQDAPFLDRGTTCRVSNDPCRSDSTCDGAGTCEQGPLRPAGTVCEGSPNPCLGNKVCDAGGACVAGGMLPAGTVCRISTNPCIGDSVCDIMGRCLQGAFRDGSQICLNPSACHATGRCDGGGGCVAPPINEGRECTGSNRCLISTCQAGQCVAGTPRQCFPDNACLKKDACDPAQGCIEVNICDMTQPDLSTAPDLAGRDLSVPDLAGRDLSVPDLPGADLASGQDLAGRDLAGVDLAGVDLAGVDLAGADGPMSMADATMSMPDGGEVSADDMADGGIDMPAPDTDMGMSWDRDGGGPYGEDPYGWPTELHGGMCMCRAGQRGDAPVGFMLVLGGAALILRRRRNG